MTKYIAIIVAPISLLALTCCAQNSGQNEEESCCGVVTSQNIEDITESAESGNTADMAALVEYHYSKVPGRNPSISELGTATGIEAERARYWAYRLISTGNRYYLNVMISSHLRKSRDIQLEANERRSELMKALWLWQMLPPSTLEWRFSNIPPEDYDVATMENSDRRMLNEIHAGLSEIE